MWPMLSVLFTLLFFGFIAIIGFCDKEQQQMVFAISILLLCLGLMSGFVATLLR